MQCIQGAVNVRKRQQYVADLFRDVEGILGGIEPMTFDLTATRKEVGRRSTRPG